MAPPKQRPRLPLPDIETKKHVLWLAKGGVNPLTISTRLNLDFNSVRDLVDRQKARRLFRKGETNWGIQNLIRRNRHDVGKFVEGLPHKQKPPKKHQMPNFEAKKQKAIELRQRGFSITHIMKISGITKKIAQEMLQGIPEPNAEQIVKSMDPKERAHIIQLHKNGELPFVLTAKANRPPTVTDKVLDQKIISLANEKKTIREIQEFFNGKRNKQIQRFLRPAETNTRSQQKVKPVEKKLLKKRNDKISASHLMERIRSIDSEIQRLLERKEAMERKSLVGKPEYKNIRHQLLKLREEKSVLRQTLG